MKFQNLLIYTFCLFMLLTTCSDETLDDIDTNPNVVNDPPLNSLLPQVIISYSNGIVGSRTGVHAAFISEQTSAVLGFNNYTDLTFASNPAWENGYLMLNDLNLMISKAVDNEAWAYVGIGEILKAFTFTTLIDLYGDIPFSEAVKDEIRDPKFDSHQELYSQIQDMLDSAIEALGRDSRVIPSVDDFAFNGDLDMWVKTAYGLKARLYNKLSNLDGTGSAQMALAAIENSFTATSENFTLNIFIDSPNNGNPLSVAQLLQPQSAIGEGLWDIMLSFTPNNIIEEDPRSVLWFTTVNGQRIPAPSGTAEADFGEPRMDGAIYSKPEFLKFNAAPLPILSYVELLFIKAEANHRLGNTAEAYDAYIQAIQSALEQSSSFNPEVQLDPTQISNYLSFQAVSPGADNLTMETIIYQKYIYYFLYQWIEAYNETRKHDFFTANNPEGRANRLLYPDSEVARNPNTPSDVTFFTIFEPGTKLIWAK